MGPIVRKAGASPIPKAHVTVVQVGKGRENSLEGNAPALIRMVKGKSLKRRIEINQAISGFNKGAGKGGESPS